MSSTATTTSETLTKNGAPSTVSQPSHSSSAPSPQAIQSGSSYPYSTFTPPRVAPRLPMMPFGGGHCVPRRPPRSPIFSTHHVVGIALIGLIIAVVTLPMVIVNLIVYGFSLDSMAESNLIPGYNLTKLQLYATGTFVLVDLTLFGLVYFIANYSNAFFGCSTELHFKVFCGSKYVPLILISRLLQPLAIIQDEYLDLGLIWMIRGFILILILVTVFPLFLSEIRLLRSIQITSPLLPPAAYPFGNDPLLTHTGLKNIDFGPDERLKQQLYERRCPGMILFAIKATGIFFFLLEISVINFGLLVPLSLDYPLIISAINLAFVYYSHKPVIAKYHIIDSRQTAITAEFGCLDGRKCCNSFRPNRIIVFAPTEKTFLQAAAVEYTVYSAFELPKWLQKTLYKNKQIKMVSSIV